MTLCLVCRRLKLKALQIVSCPRNLNFFHISSGSVCLLTFQEHKQIILQTLIKFSLIVTSSWYQWLQLPSFPVLSCCFFFVLGCVPFVRIDHPDHFRLNKNFTFNQSYPANRISQNLDSMQEGDRFLAKTLGKSLLQCQNDWSVHGPGGQFWLYLTASHLQTPS